MSVGDGAPAAPLRLGLIVPCRNEERVIGRKLANLARLRWPAGAHRLVVVDDESADGTAGRARALCREHFAGPRADGAAIEARVVANSVRPGKAGAISQGLAEIQGAAELAVLTDADVVCEPEALLELERAFREDSRLGMACGAQVFVGSLPEDGSTEAPGGAPPLPAAGRYDRITAWVRRQESRSGRLFSVHGQLLAWRTALGIAPARGIAADDLDLMLRARSLGARVSLVGGARFQEVKTPPGPDRREQELRRARAYVQVLARHEHPLSRGLVDRLQWLAYRRLPFAASTLLLLGLVLAWAAGHELLSERIPHFTLWAVAALLVLRATRPARDLLDLLATIDLAVHSERRAPLSDRWEMRRT